MHKCQAVGCRAQIDDQFLMCPRHWYMLPKGVQAKVWKYWANGKDEEDPVAATAAVDLAIAQVAHKESRIGDIELVVEKEKAARVIG